MKYLIKKTALAVCFFALLSCCNAEKQSNENEIKVYYKISGRPKKERNPTVYTKKDTLFWDSIYQNEKATHDYIDDFVAW